VDQVRPEGPDHGDGAPGDPQPAEPGASSLPEGHHPGTLEGVRGRLGGLVRRHDEHVVRACQPPDERQERGDHLVDAIGAYAARDDQYDTHGATVPCW
jgi:hypothetical protein